MEEVTVDFSAEELDQLFSACGVRVPPGLEVEEPLPEVRDALRAVVGRSLRARGMLAEVDGTWQPVASIAQVIALLGRPAVAAKASLSRGGETQTRRYGMVGSVGVEQRALPGSLHRLTLFETDDLLERVLAFVGRPTGPRAEAPAFGLPGNDLRQALRLAAGGDTAAVRYVLRSARVPRVAVVAFSNVLTPEAPLVTFEVTYLASDGIFRGGELTWIDNPEHGLWSFPPLVEGAVTVEVTPMFGDELVEELYSYMPSGLAKVG